MFKWLKNILSGSNSANTVEKEPNNYSQYKTATADAGSATGATASQSTKPAQKKSTTKKTAEQTPAKRGRKKIGVTKTDLNKMNKDELEAYAKKEYKVDLDKRRKKADLVAEVLKLAK